MMKALHLDGQLLKLEEIAHVARDAAPVQLAEEARRRMEASRRVVERILAEGRTVYGVNTGFGKLADVRISAEELDALQLNLIRSHACGVGEPLSPEETRAVLLLRANVLARGLSGARPIVAETLVHMLNADVLPVVPERGSVGASGDLAPLAHVALCAVGEGDATWHGERMPAARALQLAGIAPLQLEAKEGLALLNGTQAMAAVGALALLRAEMVARVADVAGAMTLEALRGTPVAFDARIVAARPHPGQQQAAEHLRALLSESQIRLSHLENDPRVQDAYSLRCMPQVHGAVRDALEHARRAVETETGSATDNPLVFVEADEVLSGGNFHGAPLALAFDYAAMALVHLAAMSERRIERLVNPDLNEGLPPFLTRTPGLSSGFMIAHVVAVALLNEMKLLAHPASADNVPTSANKEDHVSMGMTAANKLRRAVELAEQIVAIELLVAAEGVEFRAPLRPGKGVERAHRAVRQRVARLEADRSLSADIQALAESIRRGDFDL